MTPDLNNEPSNNKDAVYEDKGFYVPEDGTTVEQFHEDSKRLEGAIKEAAEETGIVITNHSKERLESGEVLEIPNRIAFQEKNINLSRLPIWFLNALSSMSVSELESFRERYREELSVSELASLQIIDGLLNGDKDCSSIYWTIQMKMLNKTNIANQINVNVNTNNNAVSHMLDEIANKIASAANNLNPPTP